MRHKQNQPRCLSKKLKKYHQESMMNAYKAVKNDKMPVEKAARLFGVPAQTLRDRVLNKVNINGSWGKSTLFTQEEEGHLVDYLTEMSGMGYSLNRSQLTILASDLAKNLGKLEKTKQLSDKWHYAFMKRWDHKLKLIKPRALTSLRAAAVTQEAVNEYFNDLQDIIDKYRLNDKPHLIFNLDETGLSPEHKPSKIITSKSSSRTQAITSPNSGLTTLIACCNAAGTVLPPYYVFKGKLNNDTLLQGAAPNAAYAMSETGWSNRDVLLKYLNEHFLKYIQRSSSEDKILLIFDGHTTHTSLAIINWAKEHNIALFVLPSHASHVVQPLDVGCFGAFKSCYYSECSHFMAQQRGRVITKYDIASLSSRAYLKTMTPLNIISSFRKCGIYPWDPTAIPADMFLPSKSFPKQTQQETTVSIEELLTQKMNESAPKLKECHQSKNTVIKKPKISGKCITEDEIISELEQYDMNKKTTKPTKKSVKTKPATESPKPSTSGAFRKLDFDIDVDLESDNETPEAYDEKDLCCVCKRFYPPGIENCMTVSIVNWANCDKCGHWVHLKFCSPVRVVRRHSEFKCPHCC